MGVPGNNVDDYPTILEGYTMKIEYDPVHDLLNLEFLPGVEIEESAEIDGIDVSVVRKATKR